ncbi:MBL fold metallo-hydrolase [Epilithonimonas xixisoli]|uniref:Glyoxylase-like metal-dependent hydrolase (Beta-lactamase superfamily II) n=1 Tax=Epilithonimonas xixisoli TaxID=1476462 RepID=A0A4R8IBB7_9FLAO|nr:MBL fold metallo-hydrolase [Epilithonimonas xixisoli]TDX84641.1 glyoxylase-like metal-dependent hydrolase (beta-lactamase superfamily II) [Epilithonimonas xixisoli]
MKIEQIYTGCLAQGAYYIVSENEAAIIDPLREIKPYLDRLEKDQVKLKYIFETHFHADFVSGHLDLSKKTDAPIVYGPTAKPEFEAIIAEDNQIFEIGKIKIKVLHTPGHTLESSTYLLIDENGQETAIFSGDTLFLGDVGRPDLAQKVGEITEEDLAGMLYESLHSKILPLDDSITVYPAHGAGSACGKNMQKETVDTLGNQKRTNYALNQPTKESFIAEVLDGLTAPPKYFGMNVALNKGGYESFEKVLKKGNNPISVEDFETAVEETGALILDTRSAADFHKGFVPNSINIGIKGDFAPWVGAMIVDVQQPIILVSDLGSEEEVITRLSRVGFDNVVGFLEGGFESWKNSGKEIDEIKRISADQFASEYSQNQKVIDVRKETEYEAEHIDEAYSKPLAYINDWVNSIDNSEHFHLHCAGGYRSMIAASILQSRGYRNFTEVEGGFNAIKKFDNVPTSNFVCQTKTL